MKYEIFDHTGDVGIIVYGKNFTEILRNALIAVFDLTFPGSKPSTDITSDMTIQGNSNEEILINLLSRVISLVDSEETIYYDVDQITFVTGGANLRLSGMRIVEGMEYEYVLKAVTYHDLDINLIRGYAKILFDI
ncbi:MAG: archease [Thermoplasmataceae archaeon]